MRVRYMPERRGRYERTTRRRCGSVERNVSYSHWQRGSDPDPESGDDREAEMAEYATGEERRERAGRSESARVIRGSQEEKGRMVARAWMRERALDMDSHQECIGSSVGAAERGGVEGLWGFGVLEELDEDGEELVLRWLRWKSMAANWM